MKKTHCDRPQQPTKTLSLWFRHLNLNPQQLQDIGMQFSREYFRLYGQPPYKRHGINVYTDQNLLTIRIERIRVRDHYQRTAHD